VTRYGPWLLVCVALALVAFVRIRLKDVPLERDEGGFAYTAQLLLAGIPPYAHAYDMRLPGTYLAYAAFIALGGESPAAIHLGLLAVNAATVVAMFLLARRLFDATAGVTAAAAYALLSLSPSVLGLAAHTTHLVVLPVVAAFYLLVRRPPPETRPAILMLAGILMGIAFVTKQHAVSFGVFAGLWLCLCEWRTRPRRWKASVQRIAAYALGCVLPFALVCAAAWWLGVFERFWFWTVTYAREYATPHSLSIGMAMLKVALPSVILPAVFLWLLAALGAASVLVREPRREVRELVTGFSIASLLSIAPGFHFREHYFVLLLPAVALLAGAGVSQLRAALARQRIRGAAAHAVLGGLVLAACLHPVWAYADAWFRLGPAAVSRAWYSSNPFIESIPIAEYLRAHSAPDARIAVVGSEPQIYFYAQRRSATGYLYMYGLMEAHPFALEMHEDMIAEIEAAKPEYIVFVSVPQSWQRTPYSHTALFDWLDRYTSSDYRTVGIVDIVDPEHTEYRWDDDVIGYRPQTNTFVLVMRRNDASTGS
jgi:hypothetical protein